MITLADEWALLDWQIKAERLWNTSSQDFLWGFPNVYSFLTEPHLEAASGLWSGLAGGSFSRRFLQPIPRKCQVLRESLTSLVVASRKSGISEICGSCYMSRVTFYPNLYCCYKPPNTLPCGSCGATQLPFSHLPCQLLQEKVMGRELGPSAELQRACLQLGLVDLAVVSLGCSPWGLPLFRTMEALEQAQ